MTIEWFKQLKADSAADGAASESSAKGRVVRYDPADPVELYGEAFSALFPSEEERRRELERRARSGELSFCQGALSRFIGHERSGGCVVSTITTNEDDLLVESPFLFNGRLPQVFTEETLTPRSMFSTGAPTVLKLAGDAHLPPPGPGEAAPRWPAPAREKLREMLPASALVFLGYSACDQCLLDVLEEMEPDGQAGKVYWVNSALPEGRFAEWLERRDSVWSECDDYDRLMRSLHTEFGLADPAIERLERMLKVNAEPHRALSLRDAEEGGADDDPDDDPDGSGGFGAGADGDGSGDSDGEGVGSNDRSDGGGRTGETGDLTAIDTLMRAIDAAAKDDGAPAPDEGDPSALCAAAMFALERLNDAAGAVRLLEKARALDRKSPTPFLLMAYVALRAYGDLDQAEARLDEGVAAAPRDPAVAIAQARFFAERRGWPGEAMAAFARLKRSPAPRGGAAASAKATALAEKALIEIRRGDADAAEGSLIQAARLAPATEEARSMLAFAQAALAERDGEFDAAEVGYRAAIDESPANVRALIGHARFLERRRRDRAAAGCAYGVAIDAAPASATPVSAFAAFMDRIGGAPRAAEARHLEALALEPNDPEALRAYAEHLSWRRIRPMKAADAFHRALALSPGSSALLRAYGQFLDRCRGDHHAAESHLRAAVDANPADAEAHEALARFLFERLRGAKEAEQHYVEALRLSSERDVAGRRLLGFLNMTRPTAEEALRAFEEAMVRIRPPRRRSRLARPRRD